MDTKARENASVRLILGRFGILVFLWTLLVMYQRRTNNIFPKWKLATDLINNRLQGLPFFLLLLLFAGNVEI